MDELMTWPRGASAGPEGPGVPAPAGAPGPAAGADVAAGWSVGLDVGGTKTLGVLVGPDGAVGPSVRLTARPGAAGVAGTAAEAVHALVAQAGLTPGALAGVGIGLPGIVDPAAGRVEHAVNLAIETAVPLAADVSAALGGVPVRLENDLNVAALGAAHLLPDPAPDLAFLALGTGLAAGLVLDGRLRRGASGVAGEIGHLVHVPGGLPCPCGQRGCLEQYASGGALSAAWPGPGDRPAPVALFEAADSGDAGAVAVRDRFAGAVAAAVRVLLLTTDVAHVVVGGGVSELGDPLLRVVRARLDDEARDSAFLAAMHMAERVTLAPRGVPVGAVGAALVGRKET
ncbi:ROK family protein [Cellulomonas sp. ACRRI]|uniref:ROK family protein n=1 Tax=Cellulomonas sp. ACRRI TaxID=2918188 RepID=UPI001EF184E2|nr:ROK family protein [Cellulomonas sp. ACRRI]MCG7287135.1 ROK family protein [Cellulomonas sp. ACRRI]